MKCKLIYYLRKWQLTMRRLQVKKNYANYMRVIQTSICISNSIYFIFLFIYLLFFFGAISSDKFWCPVSFYLIRGCAGASLHEIKCLASLGIIHAKVGSCKRKMDIMGMAIMIERSKATADGAGRRDFSHPLYIGIP